jgi:hypothetical protein
MLSASPLLLLFVDMAGCATGSVGAVVERVIAVVMKASCWGENVLAVVPREGIQFKFRALSAERVCSLALKLLKDKS